MPSARAVLELLSRLERRHASGEQKALDVVLVLTDSLNEWLPLLTAGVDAVGGVVQLASEDTASGVVGVLDKELEARITAVLSVPVATGAPLKIVFREEGGLVSALLDGVAADVASPGLLTVGAAASILFSADLRTHEAAAIGYSEAGLDPDLAEGLWRLHSDHLADSRFGELRTLIVLVENSRTDPGRHCGRGNSAAFRLSQLGLERRKPWGTDRADIHALLTPAQDQPIVLFLGAGFSASSGLPVGDELRNRALRRFMAADALAPYESVAADFFRYVDANERLLAREHDIPIEAFVRSLTLERVLREEEWRVGEKQHLPTIAEFTEEANAAASKRGRAPVALDRLIAASPLKVILVTVNFDEMIEAGGGVKAFVTDDEFRSFPDYLERFLSRPEPVPLLKLHGTISSPESILATVESIGEGLSPAKSEALRALLRGDQPHRWVYVGYSMRDPDVADVLGLREFREALDESWVAPFPIQTAQEFAEQHRDLKDRSFWNRSITTTADNFFEELGSAATAKADE